MKAETQKWGNSLAIRIPSAFAREMGLGVGTQVTLEIHSGTLVIKRPRKKQYKLDTLLSQVTKSNLHSETDWGATEGTEAW